MAQLDLDNYEMLLAEAGRIHGDVCHGIRIGVRMTMCGLRRIGIRDPHGADRKKLIVVVEIDRCAADSIMALTGCRPGRRSMKVLDYGKMAATFINLETGRAVRVAARMAKDPSRPDGMPDMAAARDEDLFAIMDVRVPLRPEDMPGKPLRRVVCPRCGDTVMDGREVQANGVVLCPPCAAGKTYYVKV